MRVNVKGVIIPQDYKRVYDWFDMESTTPKDVADALAAANGQPIEVYINSGGGYVHAGADIYTALCEYPGEVNIKIIYAASAASVVAMAGHSMISPVGQMMIHNVYSSADGDYRALHRAGDRLDIACDALANAYMRKTGKTRDEIRAMMDAETWVDARRAVELGLVDEVMGGELVAADVPGLLPESVVQKTLAMFRDQNAAALAQARANLAALENSNRSYNLPDVTPAQTNAAPQMVTINNFGGQTAHTDPSETNEYRTAFMNFVCRGTEIPADLRASVAPMLNVAATTTTTDAGAVIPTTITREIIREMKSYGNLYAKIRKLNVQGGVEFPILTLKPTANWIGESKSSDDQKLTANTKVSFSYYGMECKIAQTLLAAVVTFDEFQQMFVPLAVEAIVAAKEKAIIFGTGSGQFLGITKDSRVPTKNVVVLSPDEIGDYSAWHKKVIAKIPKAYRKGEFIMAQGTFDGYIDGMVDKNGQPIGRVNYGIDGGETYRFCGKPVETVEDDIIANFDAAAKDDVVAVYFNPSDYAENSNGQFAAVKWMDHDDNTVKTKVLHICDGKLLDPNGVIIIKKGETAKVVGS